MKASSTIKSKPRYKPLPQIVSTEPIIIYTDGACRNNPGKGGYGFILMYKNFYKEGSGGFTETTNNRMELMAIIKALQTLKTNMHPIQLYTDSSYVVNAINKGWLKKWIATDFSGGKKNKDLWLTYEQLAAKLNITVNWVKGHSSNPYNNKCDQLATTAADSNNLQIDVGYEKEKKLR